MEWQPRYLAASTHLWWLVTAVSRFFLSASPRFPSASHMISTLLTPLSSQVFFSSFRYFSSRALSLKNWLTYSTAEMPYSFFATAGESGVGIFFPHRLLLNDHSAHESSKDALFPLCPLLC